MHHVPWRLIQLEVRAYLTTVNLVDIKTDISTLIMTDGLDGGGFAWEGLEKLGEVFVRWGCWVGPGVVVSLDG